MVCLGFLLAAPWVLGTLPRSGYEPGSLRRNIAAHLASRHGVLVRPAEMILPGGEGPSLRPTEVYFLGRRRGERNRDVYFAHIIHTKETVPVHASPAFSLSRTAGADEALLSHDNRRYLAYASLIKGKASVITVLDLHGLSREATESFTATERLQQRLTNWQDTGLWRGLDRLEVRLPLPQAVTLKWTNQGLVIRQRTGRWEAVLDPAAARILRGPAKVRRVRVGQRAFVAWAVDTVRSFSFVGPDRIAWLEQQVYGLVDQARRMSGAEVTASEIQDEMALPVVSATRKIRGWPPPPLPPILKKTMPGEGKWTEVKGPFLPGKKREPALFAMTFVRPDKERLFARVYFVAWDPRRVELHMTAGTREPRSSTGFRGSGIIPRERSVLRRLVGAFNGGFQSVHGDYGMMVDGKLAIPAKPWAATVARLADGSTAFGTWDGAAEYGVTPAWIRSFRQNLTALVEGGKANPWRRGSWGGKLGSAKTGGGPEFRVLRSGLCLHRSGHVMYVQGEPVDGPMLGEAMHKVGCVYGMMLDINKTHVGMEFYNIRLPGEKPQHDAATFKPRRRFAVRGEYPRMKGYTYTMREVTRGTGIRCPNWIHREARDFFYLLRRDHLPGADLKPLGASQNEGRWTVATLPAAAVSFPQAMARAFLQPAGLRRVHLLALDMRWLEVRVCVPRADRDCLPEPGDRDVLAVLPLGSFDHRRALWTGGKISLGKGGGRKLITLKPLRPGGPALPSLATSPDSGQGAMSIEAAAPGSTGQVRAALCVRGSGQLLYATSLTSDEDLLRKALGQAGCKEVVSLGSVEPLVFSTKAGLRSVLGDALPPVASSPSLVLRRSTAPWGTRIFSHVKVQPRKVWLAVQPERTRSVQLRRANRAIARQGLPPIRSLRALCRKPYAEVEELRQYRWRDPVTRRWTCGGKKKQRRKRKKK